MYEVTFAELVCGGCICLCVGTVIGFVMCALLSASRVEDDEVTMTSIRAAMERQERTTN